MHRLTVYAIKTSTILEAFSFKKLSDSTPFLDDPVRLETAPTGPGKTLRFCTLNLEFAEATDYPTR